MWERAAGRILLLLLRRRAAVVMLAGGTDTGKSTFSIYLANVALCAGISSVSIIDADIGQGDLAPPGAIGGAVISSPAVDLRDVDAGFVEFVGVTTPAGSERLVARRLQSILCRMGRGRTDLCIINTDGYVSDGGLQYKRMLAKAIRPDVVLVLGCDKKLAASLAGGPWLLLRARSADQAAKTRQDRAGRRAEQFTRYVGEGRGVEKNPSGLAFVYRGRLLPKERALQLLMRGDDDGGMFVGLGSKGLIAGFGLVEAASAGAIAIKTGVQNFTTVYLSNIGIKEDGAEVRL
jgi:polynucleotide 5'-hydroxyl-kinase GRC3/NOL9